MPNARGLIKLPPRICNGRKAGSRDKVQVMILDTTPVTVPIKDLLPLKVEVIQTSGPLLTEFKSLLV
jgi:hypothetical protein